jgi:hypothetical protein
MYFIMSSKITGTTMPYTDTRSIGVGGDVGNCAAVIHTPLTPDAGTRLVGRMNSTLHAVSRARYLYAVKMARRGAG